MSVIILNRITESDATVFFKLAHSDIEAESGIDRFLPSYCQDPQSTKELVKDFSRQHDGRLFHYYMIKVDGNPVGFISAEYTRVYFSGLYVTYFLGYPYRGLHYMRIALDKLFEKVSESGLELPFIFDINAENTQSRYVIEKLAKNPVDSYEDRNKQKFLTYIVYP